MIVMYTYAFREWMHGAQARLSKKYGRRARLASPDAPCEHRAFIGFGRFHIESSIIIII